MFSVASLACGLAPTAPALYIARALQGAGAAFLLAPALAIIGHAFHEESERACAWALWGGVMGLTMVLSPLIGGGIGTLLGWRWAFYINLPICAALALAVWKTVGESRDPTPRALDFAGIALFTLGMFSLTWALITGPEHGWTSAAVAARAAAGAALFVAFGFVEKRREHPMLDLRLFGARSFVGAVLAMFAYAASAQVMASLLPLFLQNAQGDTALAAGLGMLPFALAMLVLPQVGRRLGRHMRSHRILTLGLAVVAVGNLLMAHAANGHGGLVLVLGMAVLGSGGGLLNGETQKAIMGTIAPHRAGMASGISTTARFSGILLGFAGLGAVLASGVRSALASGMRQAQVAVAPGFVDHVVAGDLGRALQMYPAAMSQVLGQVARESHGRGFSAAFVVAAAVAAIAAVAVHALFVKRDS
jgi:MFS family permease